ncbi:MAG TPA: hypothetical protein VJZ71_10335 [Phycisphaerae bacterium]|nr:hypothetical protein [Phycisphaerae bacterium]
MRRTDHIGCGEDVSARAMDRAMRAFWRGSARPIDRLAGASERDGRTFGEILLLLLSSGFARRGEAARPAKDE